MKKLLTAIIFTAFATTASAGYIWEDRDRNSVPGNVCIMYCSNGHLFSD